MTDLVTTQGFENQTLEECLHFCRQKKWKIYEAEVESDEGNMLKAYFKKPGFKEMSMLHSSSDLDPIQVAELLFDSCFLFGEAEITQDDMLKMSCFEQLTTLINNRKVAKLKKL